MISSFKKSRLLGACVGTVLAVGISYFLLRTITFADFLENVRSVNIVWVMVGFFLYVVANSARVKRFRFLTEPQSRAISFHRFFSIVCIHNFFNAVIPFRLGEASYLYLMKREKVLFGANAASLLVSRVLDLAVISLVFLLSLIFIDRSMFAPDVYRTTLAWVIGLIVGVTAVLIVLYHIVSKITSREGREKKTHGGWLFNILVDVRSAFIRIIEGGNLGRLACYSLLVWGFVFLSGFALIQALGLSLTLSSALFVYAFPVLTSVLPIQFPGGFGSYEGPFAGVLILMGVAIEVAVSSAFILHVIELLFTAFLGALGLLAYSIFRPKENHL